ncbi:lathosterol oxidase-like [Bacillus rossius redtenbacheri]|uniref:lathosterol oxidase-like n=1 Tax=Bacillus rossius redtenbacheri TaxID=93214 RepID=UPI002FDD2315
MGSDADAASKKQNGGPTVPYDPMAVTWMDSHSETVDKVWGRVPELLRPVIVFLAVFVMGATMRGEWLIMFIHCLKYLGIIHGDASISFSHIKWSEVTLESLYLKNVFYYWLAACTVSYTMYFAIGGFLHWYYYLNKRDRPHEWKCQPEKFMPPDLERHEIVFGCTSLAFTSTLSGAVACWVSNGGWSTVYYEFGEFSWTWWFAQWPVIFVYQDYTTYWLHRIYHTPFLYKHFHKMHHKYKQPTAFSVTAIHPVEILHIQIFMMLPIFSVPIHFVPFYVIALFTYYNGIIDHSGIDFKAPWWLPWQPDTIFHDNHHQYFHVNFGFNCYFWDMIHGTYRRKDRIYTEDTFYGQGKSLKEASKEEIITDLKERESENPIAFRGNYDGFKISQEELKKIG